MNNDLFYNDILICKNGTKIPVLSNGHTIESKYNPDKDAEKTISSIDNKFNFYVLFGIGSGLVLKYLYENNPNSFFLCFENNQRNLDFLIQNDFITKYTNNKHFYFSTIDNLSKNIIDKYIPSLFGDLKIIENHNWMNEYTSNRDFIYQSINKTIESIAADYSVQAHFGKLWHHNFFSNLQQLSKTQNKQILSKIDTSKKALIFGAGPSVDEKIYSILNNRDEYIIIATDTISSTLIDNKIIPDIIISIDGQHISYSHFMLNLPLLQNTLFLFDITANSSAIYHLIENKCSVMLFISGHPLSAVLNQYCKDFFLSLYTGTGTVIISALDLAIKSGFSRIEVIGADFSYSSKPYAKGTYLDSIYSVNSNKINNIETKYDSLMFRTNLFKTESSATTEILCSYKKSFESFLLQNKCTFIIENQIYKITNHSHYQFSTSDFELQSFNFYDFVKYLDKFCFSRETDIFSSSIFPFLPYIAWLRTNNKNLQLEEFVKLAQSSLLLYN